MENLPNCPQCNCEYVYDDGTMLVCPECSHEFRAEDVAEAGAAPVYKDANGTILVSGDDVIAIQDLKVKGASPDIKKGTKLKNITLFEPDDGVHNVQCKIPGYGTMLLRTGVVKKA